MIEYPNPPNIGPPLWIQWGKDMKKAGDANRPVSGPGAIVADVAGGRAVTAASSSAMGIQRHDLTLGEVIPDPFKIVAQVTEQVSELMESAIPSASAIAAIITGPLVDAATTGASPSSVVSSVESLFSGAVGILDSIEGFVEDAIGDFSSVAGALQAHFALPNAKTPRNGDRIYTEATGIVYELWKQDESGIPSGNTIFRVPFSIGDSTWVAITTFPAPDIGSMVEQITGIVINLLRSLVANVVDAALQGVGAAVIALYGIVQDILDTIAEILGAIDALDALIDAIQEILDAAVDVEVIGKDGVANTIKVLEQTPGEDLKKDFTWIQSEDGIGKKTKIIWFGGEPVTNVDDVTWKNIDWIAQDGTMMVAQILTLIKPPFEYPKEETLEGAMEEVTVSTCDDGDLTILKKPSE